MATPERPEIKLDREALTRFWRAVRAFLWSEVRGRAIAMGVGLLAVLLAINLMNVVNSYVGRDFMTALEQRDRAQFLRMALVYVAVFGVQTLIAAFERLTEERLGLLWRFWLTERLVGAYMGAALFYRLQVGGMLPNPDQRIADDVRAFTTGTLSLVIIWLNGTMTIVAFAGVLWSIRPLLLGIAVGYALVGSLLAIWLGRPLVRLNYDQSDAEALLRAELVHVRENAESVVLLRRADHLLPRLSQAVSALTMNMRRIITVNWNLNLFTGGYNYLIQIIPALVVAPLFIRGDAPFGEIPQAAMAFSALVGAFSLVVNQMATLSSYAAVLARLSALGDAADDAPPLGSPDIVVVEEDRRLAVDRLTLRDGRVLVRDLALAVDPGERVLLLAPADVNDALQRAIAGMWPHGSGRIQRPSDIMLLPERPYLPPGTLRQLLASCPGATVDAAEAEAALRAVGAERVLRQADGLDVDLPSHAPPSLQEQRRLELARMLLARPAVVVLAELDGALGGAAAADVRRLLSARGIGSLTLETSMPEASDFDTIVRVTDDGAWTQAQRHGATG
jgi:putative ATP-binding cassette transporter